MCAIVLVSMTRSELPSLLPVPRMMSLTEESISDWFQGVLQHLDDIHAGKVKKH